MSEAVRVGIIGCGGRGTMHGRLAAESDEVTVAAWCDIDRSKARRLADQHGGEVVDSLEQMLADDSIAGVAVCVLHDKHFEMGMAAAAAGKAIMMEIPLAPHLEQARELIDAAERAGVVLLVTHTLRFRGENRYIKQVIDSGSLGRVYFARYHNEHYVSLGYFGRRGGADNFAVEASVMHHGDLMQWWLGDMDSLMAYGLSATDVSREHGVYDHLNVIYQWSDQAIAETTCSWLGYPIQLRGRERLSINGTRGSLLMGYEGPLRIWRDGAEQLVPPEELAKHDVAAEIVHFARCIRGSETPVITPREACRAVELMLLSLESARSGRRVNTRG